jgi:hypothetical protein
MSDATDAPREPFYLSTTTVRKVAGVTREAVLADGSTVTFGVHGPIKDAYGLDREPDLPLPVDFIVASAVG